MRRRAREYDTLTSKNLLREKYKQTLQPYREKGLLFCRVSYRTSVFIGMALLNSISLQMFQKKMKIFSTAVSINLTDHLQFFFKMCFIGNDKHVRDNNTYNNGGIGQCEMYFVKEHLIEKSNQTIAIRIIRNKEAFLLHHTFGYLKEL